MFLCSQGFFPFLLSFICNFFACLQVLDLLFLYAHSLKCESFLITRLWQFLRHFYILHKAWFFKTVDLVKKNNLKSVFPPKRTDTCLAPVYPFISGSPMTPTTCSWHSTNCSTALRCLFFPLSVSWTGDTEWQRLISAHVTERRFVHVQVFSWRTQE